MSIFLIVNKKKMVITLNGTCGNLQSKRHSQPKYLINKTFHF